MMMTRPAWGFASLLVLAGLAQPAHAGPVFSFDNLPGGTATPFSDTEGGVSATFSSPGIDPGAFLVTPSFFAPPMNGNVLADAGAAPDANIPLDIRFSTAVTSITLDFATDDTGPPSTLVLAAYSGGTAGTPVGMSMGSGTTPLGYFAPQGELTFASTTPFDTVVLSDDAAPAFAIDNVSVNATGVAVPEPMSVTLLLYAVAVLGGEAFRRRGRATA